MYMYDDDTGDRSQVVHDVSKADLVFDPACLEGVPDEEGRGHNWRIARTLEMMSNAQTNAMSNIAWGHSQRYTKYSVL